MAITWLKPAIQAEKYVKPLKSNNDKNEG